MSFSLPLLFVATTAVSSQAQAVPVHPNHNAVLWYQTSAEFNANSVQTYTAARNQLLRAIADPNWTALTNQTGQYQQLPPAVIVDIDETILDNSPAAAQAVLQGKTNFDAALWDAWVAKASAQAVPGAVKFLNLAEANGVKVLYISNRECTPRKTKPTEQCPQHADTLKNLRAVGIKQLQDNQLWLKGQQTDWSSEKESRRVLAAKQYRVVMLFGDDFGDFLPNVKKNITPQQRLKLSQQYEHQWGEKWFMLSNPTYGSWQTILNQPDSQYLRGF